MEGWRGGEGGPRENEVEDEHLGQVPSRRRRGEEGGGGGLTGVLIIARDAHSPGPV